MDESDFLLCETRADWRRWLRDHHEKESEVLLLRYKKGSGRKCVSYDEAVEEAICFGWIDGKLNKLDEERFVIRFSPRKEKSVWSLLNKQRAIKMIKEKKMTPAGKEKIAAAKASGAWDNAYTSSGVPPMPRDLESALKKDKVAWKNFKSFADTYRGGYIGWVLSAKREETRRKRITAVVERSRKNNRPGVDP